MDLNYKNVKGDLFTYIKNYGEEKKELVSSTLKSDKMTFDLYNYQISYLIPALAIAGGIAGNLIGKSQIAMIIGIGTGLLVGYFIKKPVENKVSAISLVAKQKPIQKEIIAPIANGTFFPAQRPPIQQVENVKSFTRQNTKMRNINY